MNIILFTKFGHRTWRLHLDQPRNALLMALSLGLLCLTALQIGEHLSRPEGLAQRWRAELHQQRRLIDSAKADARADATALALRMARMQAQVMRLEALGERLAKMAKLDKGEFDFRRPPAIGGPLRPTELDSGEFPDFSQSLERLKRQLDDREQQLVIMESMLLNRSLQQRAQPKGAPVRDGWVSSGFGNRTDPFTGHKALHAGVDFAAPAGTEVIAVAGGVVAWSGVREGYGKMVEVNHANGYVTRYAHNERNLVKAGDTVQPGQVIALLGSTGRSTGAHVHFEVLRNGNPVDPMSFIEASRQPRSLSE